MCFLQTTLYCDSLLFTSFLDYNVVDIQLKVDAIIHGLNLYKYQFQVHVLSTYILSELTYLRAIKNAILLKKMLTKLMIKQ